MTNITVLDIFELTHEALIKLIKEEHVVTAFCYSRNDVVVRHVLNIGRARLIVGDEGNVHSFF